MPIPVAPTNPLACELLLEAQKQLLNQKKTTSQKKKILSSALHHHISSPPFSLEIGSDFHDGCTGLHSRRARRSHHLPSERKRANQGGKNDPHIINDI